MMLIQTSVIVFGRGVSLVVFMNSLWNNNIACLSISEVEPYRDHKGYLSFKERNRTGERSL